MSVAANFLSLVATRLGTDAVRQRTGRGPWSIRGVEAAAVVEPDSADAVAEVLGLCAAEGILVEPAGAGTWLGNGARRSVPEAPPLVVSTRRLNTVLEYEPADVVVGIQAGVPHDRLDAVLAEQRQVLPLDPPVLPGATVGATIALGAAGPLRASARTPRDLLLGVELATGDGRLLRFGGRVVKNVAGYDVTRLAAGSGGSLGVLTGAFLLLRAAPEADRTLVLHAGSAMEAAALALAVRDEAAPDAVEVVSPELAAELEAGSGWVVMARLRGTAEAVEDAARRLGHVHPDARDLPGSVWARLSSAEAAAPLCLRLSDSPSALGELLGIVTDLARDAVVPDAAAGWRICGHGADGIARLWRAAGSAGMEPQVLEGAAAAAASRVGERGGTLTCPAAPAALARAVRTVAPREEAALTLMRRIRDVFDPAGILLPGRQGF
jgi:glycolate oxidase FAD binding subunit